MFGAYVTAEFRTDVWAVCIADVWASLGADVWALTCVIGRVTIMIVSILCSEQY